MVCGGTFDIEACAQRVPELESRMAQPGFWDRQEEAQKVVAQLKTTKKTLDDFGSRASARDNIAGEPIVPGHGENHE